MSGWTLVLQTYSVLKVHNASVQYKDRCKIPRGRSRCKLVVSLKFTAPTIKRDFLHVLSTFRTAQKDGRYRARPRSFRGRTHSSSKSGIRRGNLGKHYTYTFVLEKIIFETQTLEKRSRYCVSTCISAYYVCTRKQQFGGFTKSHPVATILGYGRRTWVTWFFYKAAPSRTHHVIEGKGWCDRARPCFFTISPPVAPEPNTMIKACP